MTDQLISMPLSQFDLIKKDAFLAGQKSMEAFVEWVSKEDYYLHPNGFWYAHGTSTGGKTLEQLLYKYKYIHDR